MQGACNRGPEGPIFQISFPGDSSIWTQNTLRVVIEADAPFKALHASAVALIILPQGLFGCLCRVLHGKALLQLKAAMLVALAYSLLAGFIYAWHAGTPWHSAHSTHIQWTCQYTA